MAILILSHVWLKLALSFWRRFKRFLCMAYRWYGLTCYDIGWVFYAMPYWIKRIRISRIVSVLDFLSTILTFDSIKHTLFPFILASCYSVVNIGRLFHFWKLQVVNRYISNQEDQVQYLICFNIGPYLLHQFNGSLNTCICVPI